MKAGKEGGAITIGVTTGIYNKKQLTDAGADFIAENLMDIDKLLKFITLH